MRDYGKVAPTFWTGETGRALMAKGYPGGFVGAYLMTNPHANMLGLYYLPLLYVAHETGLGLEGALKGLYQCVEVDFCVYDDATQMVWVKEMAAWQIAKQLKDSDLRCKGIQKEYDGLQPNPFLGDFFDRYKASFFLTTRRENKGACKPLPYPLRSQEQEQEHLQEQELLKTLPQNDEKPPTRSKPKITPVPERFEEFWNLCPRKVGKGDGVKAFAKLTAEEIVQAIEAMPKHAKRWEVLGTEDQFIPHPSRWLNDKRFLDVLTPIQGKRQEPPKQSRQAAIAQALIGDPRYAHTAARQSGLALPHGGGGVADADAVIATVSARRRYDPGDGDGLD